MTIIRFVLPSQDHMIKKLLLIFWEIVPKTSGDGKLLQEMILVCDAYRCVFESVLCFTTVVHDCHCLLLAGKTCSTPTSSSAGPP